MFRSASTSWPDTTRLDHATARRSFAAAANPHVYDHDDGCKASEAEVAITVLFPASPSQLIRISEGFPLPAATRATKSKHTRIAASRPTPRSCMLCPGLTLINISVSPWPGQCFSPLSWTACLSFVVRSPLLHPDVSLRYLAAYGFTLFRRSSPNVLHDNTYTTTINGR